MWTAVARRARELRQDRHRVLTARGVALLFVVLGSLDIVSTNAALALGYAEGNPVMRFVQEGLGAWWAAPKLAGHLLLAWALVWLPTGRLLVGAGAVSAAYMGIVAHNFALAGVSI